jgi:glycine hydroxymethyltransferase
MSDSPTGRFFGHTMAEADPEIHAAVRREGRRQDRQIELIAPKNYMSRAVREAHDSMLAFTSVEGYPGRRWHAGVVNLDEIERLAIARAKRLFGCCYANVQPHSGTQANQAVFFALLEPGDRVVSMALDAGGHLSHGLRTNLSGAWFDVAFYGVRPDDGRIDYDEAERLALELRPKLLVCGGSSYPRHIDFERLRAIADQVGARLLADVAHISAIVAAGLHPPPFPSVDILTTTTNKNLRGPRGGLVLADDEELGRRLDAAVFPGIQGGPLPEYTVAKAVAFGEALEEDFREYAEAVVANARTLASVLAGRGYGIVTGGTDTPLVMVDLRPRGLTGDVASDALEAAGLPCNKNLVPGDPERPTVTSGLRLGTSGITTRGLRSTEAEHLGHLIADVLDALGDGDGGDDGRREAACEHVRAEVEHLADRFPLYPAETREAVAG